MLNKYDLLLHEEARSKLVIGINKLADAVKVTLGPGGRTVVIAKENKKIATTKDGVTVAKAIELLDPIENMGAMMIREAAAKTGDRAGDGTTTSTVIAQALIQEGIALMNTNISPVHIKKRWDHYTQVILEEITKHVDIDITREKLINIGTIASNNDKILGELIGGAVFDIGKHGILAVDDSPTQETFVDIVRGAQINAGYLSPYFVNANKIMSAVYNKAAILLIHGKFTALADIQNLLDYLHEKKVPLLIIADEWDLRVQAILLQNYIENGWQGVCVQTPKPKMYQYACLQDIAATTGATIIEVEKMSLKDVVPKMLGQAEKVEVNEIHTTIVGGKGSDIQVKELVKEVEELIKNSTTEVDRNFLKTRLTRLLGGVAVINVGGATDMELKEKKDRVDDAKQACKAALAEGILPGSGYPLARASEFIVKDDPVSTAFWNALWQPLFTIWDNSAIHGDRAYPDDYKRGINAQTGLEVDLIAEGIIDPFKVIKEALTNGVSAATMILLTEALLYKEYQIKAPGIIPQNIGQS